MSTADIATWMQDLLTMSLADWLALIPGALGTAVLVGIIRWRPGWAMRRLRRRHVLRQLPLRSGGLSRAQRRQLLRARVNKLLLGRDTTVNDELQWISALLEGSERELWQFTVLTSRGERALPDLADEGTIKTLVDGYAKMATSIRSASVLGAALAPILIEEANRAENVRDRLKSLLMVDPVVMTPVETEIEGGILRLLAHVGESTKLAFDLVVSHRAVTLLPDFTGRKMSMQRDKRDEYERPIRYFSVEPRIAEKVRQRLEQPGIFNGYLTRTLGYSIERDLRDGRYRLHLRLGETTYGAWLADHNVSRLAGVTTEESEPQGLIVRQMAVAVIVRSCDDRLILIQRAGHTDVHQSNLMPTANGNIQLNDAPFTVADLDEFGVPDPLAAMLRELREETGLEVERDQLAVLGLGSFDLPRNERGTHLLVALANSTLTTEEIVAVARRNAFTANGWETGAMLHAVRIDKAHEHPKAAQSYARFAPNLAPHARLALLLALLQLGIAKTASLDETPRFDAKDWVQLVTEFKIKEDLDE